MGRPLDPIPCLFKFGAGALGAVYGFLLEDEEGPEGDWILYVSYVGGGECRPWSVEYVARSSGF